MIDENGNWYYHKYLRPVCPECGSLNTYYRVLSHLAGNGNWGCKGCGHGNFDATPREYLDAMAEAEPELLAMAETDPELRKNLERDGRLPKKRYWGLTKDGWITVGGVILFFVVLSWFFYQGSGSILGAVVPMVVILGFFGVFALIFEVLPRLQNRRN